MPDTLDARIERIVQRIRETTQSDKSQPSVVASNSIVAGGDVHIHSAKAARTEKPLKKTWRDDIHSAIWKRAEELSLSPDQVYEVARHAFDRAVCSLDDLDAREIGKMFSAMFDLKRPALET